MQLQASRPKADFLEELSPPPTVKSFSVSPEHFVRKDLREDGVITPVRVQMPCNSCTSHGFCAVIESYCLSMTASDIELAAGWMHTCLAQAHCHSGVSIRGLAELLPGQMIPLAQQGSYPWEPAQCNVTGQYPAPALRQLLGAEQIRAAILNGYPVVTGMWAQDDFLTWPGGDIYAPQDKNGSFQHVVCLVGFDDHNRYWIAKNSYGSDWGDNGYVSIAYGHCGIGQLYHAYCAEIA
ncbi:MAG: C1 family peptidase [Gammaproteobacteria bacterium]